MSYVDISYGNKISEEQIENLFLEKKPTLYSESYEIYKSLEDISKNITQENFEIVRSILNDIIAKVSSIKEPQNTLKKRITFETETKLIEKRNIIYGKQKKATKYTFRSGKYNRKTFVKETSRREKSFSNKYRRKKIFKSIVKKEKGNEQIEEYKYIKRGKRGLVGGKAKGKPPEEAKCENYDSDEDSDKFYFYRVSLGHFLQYPDDSGASTSNDSERDYSRFLSPHNSDELQNKNSEELELMELEKWGSSSLSYEYEI